MQVRLSRTSRTSAQHRVNNSSNNNNRLPTHHPHTDTTTATTSSRRRHGDRLPGLRDPTTDRHSRRRLRHLVPRPVPPLVRGLRRPEHRHAATRVKHRWLGRSCHHRHHRLLLRHRRHPCPTTLILHLRDTRLTITTTAAHRRRINRCPHRRCPTCRCSSSSPCSATSTIT